MAVNFPTSLDTATQLPQPSGTSLLTSPDHAGGHTNLSLAAIAIETKVGVGAGSPTLNKFLVGTGNGTSAWGTSVNNIGLGTATIGTSIFQGGTVNNAVVGTPAITSGTANGIILGTPTIGTITVPGTVSALSFSAAIAPGVGTVTDSAGGTLTVNAQQGQVFYCAMGTAAGNRTIGTPQNPTGYQQLTYAIKASGSANGTLIWASSFIPSQDSGTPTLGTGVSWNYYGWRYNFIDSKWHALGVSKNIV